MGKKKDARLAAIEELMLTVRDGAKKKHRRAALEELGSHDAVEIREVEDRLGWTAGLDDRGYSERSTPHELVDPPKTPIAELELGDRDYSERSTPHESATTPEAEAARKAVRKAGKKKREHDAEADARAEEKAAPVQYALDAEAELELDKLRKKLVKARKTWRAASEQHGADSEEAVAALGVAQEAEVALQWRARELKLAAGFPESAIGPEPDATEKGKRHLEHLATVEVTPAPVDNPVDSDELRDPETLPPLGVDPVTGEEFDRDQGLPVTKHAHPRPKVWNPETEKLEAYTRATSYIDVLDDKSGIADWRVRSALAGAAAEGAPTVDAVREVLATYADAVAAAGDDELTAALVLEAEAAMKREMRTIAEDAERRGGTKVKAGVGTRLHHLSEYVDRGDMSGLKAENPTASEFRDLAALAALMAKTGLEVKGGMIERRIVVDSLGVTGTFDRIYTWKPEGATRAASYMGDLKTGSMDYIYAKTAMQLELYANGDLYDPATHERSKFTVNGKEVLVVHLPAGKGEARLIVLDRAIGKRGLKLAAEVRAWRSETTKAQALKTFARVVGEVTAEETATA